MLFLSISSTIMQRDSLPLKKINGMWHASTIMNRNCKMKLSNRPESIAYSLFTQSIRLVLYATPDPNINTHTTLKKEYIKKVKPIPYIIVVFMFSFVFSFIEL